MEKSRVMLIDPSGDAYGKGLATGLSSRVELFYITTKNNIEKRDIDAKVYFFFYSGKISNKIQKVYKGFTYVIAHLKIKRLIKEYNINVAHIEWLLVPKIDNYLLRMLKRTSVKLVFTAHNVLPHRNGERFISQYDSIYNIVDEIIVHGEEIKKEFISYFPQYSNKLTIEKHGVYMGQSVEIDTTCIDPIVVEKAGHACKTIIFFGNIFFNKGLDRLLKIWIKRYSSDDRFYLIVVGKKDSGYVELSEYENVIKISSNIFYKPVAVDEVELNTYISLADLIVMPYRHASMSGIIFKAAEMKKAILTTAVGAIHEYIDENCGFIVENNDDLFEDKLDNVMNTVEKHTLAEMGQRLYDYIHAEYDWNEIAQKTISEVYAPTL